MYNLRILQCLGKLSGCYITVAQPHRLMASQHKRHTKVAVAPSDQLEQIKAKYFEQRDELSSTEWQNVRSSLIEGYRHITTHNVDAVIMGVCSGPDQLLLAKSYVAHLKSEGCTPNRATLGRLLRVYNAAHHARPPLSDEEQKEILDICQTLQQEHEILDATTCENVICGLVATTNDWQRGIPLLEQMKLTTQTPTSSAYSALAAKAFSVPDRKSEELGWQLMEEMALAHKLPKCEVYLSLLQHRTSQKKLLRLMRFLEQHEILVSAQVAERLKSLTRGKSSQVNRLGKCLHCHQHLQPVAISDEQFQQLRESFLEKVLIRHDVFQKSTPEEVERFKAYVERTLPYDCVIDGLNVAYSMGTKKSPAQLAQLVANVVRYFRERRKRVLVLGRQHMRQWSKSAMHYIQANASLFLAQNLSHDDPFLLYATLKSGQDTDFFSRDLMRSHAHLLGPDLKPIFRRWQQEHQHSLVAQTQTGQIVVKEPIRFRLTAHHLREDEMSWHVPYCETYTPKPPDSFEIPEQWLCLKLEP
ncbi:uncharacterized protein Dwil_GK20077 [Drosophila willistoni]|uniref:Mitochondrial ribonuclease P catalytic subunit n=1 Tax=Drosophila willistoni TaxID=7260 RepID=B4MT19_DROWI|nr:mitochondrial ribonuclease P catalytic subunit [Drosophila willistoni]EDW75258.1 uncharacterized protein Dwil_GK20077 [Drosophila willistoni]